MFASRPAYLALREQHSKYARLSRAAQGSTAALANRDRHRWTDLLAFSRGRRVQLV